MPATMPLPDLFGEPISIYTREQALEDGTLIDISATGREAGIKFPLAITAAAWADCVAWSADDTKRKRVPNDESGRLWDVVWMLLVAIRRSNASRNNDTSIIRYQILRVAREGRGRRPTLVHLKAVCGPGDEGEPVITVMLDHED